MSFESARAGFRMPVFRSTGALWGIGVGLAARLDRPRRAIRPWAAQNGGVVVVVAPHPDDETLGAGGVAALHVDAGDEVRVVVVTDGGASRAGGADRESMVPRRAAELRRAVAVLGLSDVHYLGFPEGEWREVELRAAISALLRDAAVVYAPSCVDFHPEHARVARSVAAVLRPDQVVRVIELGVPLTPVLVNLVAEIGPVAGVKERALDAFTSQQLALSPLRRLARYNSRFYGRTAAEVFWELSAPGFARVMAKGDWLPGPSPYRGVRYRPYTDPLSAVIGRSARRELRAIAEAEDVRIPIPTPTG